MLIPTRDETSLIEILSDLRACKRALKRVASGDYVGPGASASELIRAVYACEYDVEEELDALLTEILDEPTYDVDAILDGLRVLIERCSRATVSPGETRDE